MIHPQSATGPGHKECAKACADRGVPLAVLNDKDKTLYFPAEGNKQLYKFIWPARARDWKRRREI